MNTIDEVWEHEVARRDRLFRLANLFQAVSLALIPLVATWSVYQHQAELAAARNNAALFASLLLPDMWPILAAWILSVWVRPKAR